MGRYEEEEKERKRKQFLAIMYAQKEAAAKKSPFKTVEDKVLEKVGAKGIMQSELTHEELLEATRLCTYPRNSSLRPKLMSIHTNQGTKIVPYIKKGEAGVNTAALERLAHRK